MPRRTINWLVASVLTGIMLLAGNVASAEKRIALVIGNGVYQNVPALPNPPNDASDLALGFSVTKLANARFDDMRRGLIEFGRQARGAEIALVFYAGHGMEIGGENWLIPVDAELRTDTDAENEAVSLRAVMLQVEGATTLGLVILDACRNNPFAAKMQRSIRTRAVARGLVRTEPTENVLVAYASKDGTTANDGAGRNSPFTAALLKHLETSGLEITFMFRNVRDDVMAATKREQQPFVYGSLSKEAIYLKPASAQSFDDAARMWAATKDTTSQAVLAEYIRQFGSTDYGSMARARLEELKKNQVAVGVSPSTPQNRGPVQGDLDAVRKALPADINIDTDTLGTVLTDPFFANAPPMSSSGQGRLPESLYFAESDVILGAVRARSVHKSGYGHNCNWAAA